MDMDAITEYELNEDGDTAELDDGRVLRLKIEPDDISPFDNGDDFYGRVGFDRSDRYTGRSIRPEGFTGNAEKLWYGNDGPWWWEPPTDIKRGTPEFTSLRNSVRELLAFGYNVVTVELCQGTDRYGRPIVIDVESLAGIEPFSKMGDYVPDLVSELLARN